MSREQEAFICMYARGCSTGRWQAHRLIQRIRHQHRPVHKYHRHAACKMVSSSAHTGAVRILSLSLPCLLCCSGGTSAHCLHGFLIIMQCLPQVSLIQAKAAALSCLKQSKALLEPPATQLDSSTPPAIARKPQDDVPYLQKVIPQVLYQILPNVLMLRLYSNAALFLQC